MASSELVQLHANVPSPSGNEACPTWAPQQECQAGGDASRSAARRSGKQGCSCMRHDRINKPPAQMRLQVGTGPHRGRGGSASCSGTVNQKVEPRPCLDMAPIWPPSTATWAAGAASVRTIYKRLVSSLPGYGLCSLASTIA